ncbi:DNA phosphorothioation-dependent restriction protein DptG [Rossellomorea sp. BNER]|uniref:DNA phosphorothioation-dependent restriction protein DptG n=1 Tax=Rossellomorea sp. BNER TaxID=2962031 RepID=UPI003AF2F599|nr:DNA phosphorothioation-dependent restriction protein DptG [Rossellomorea sp. BNER]
MGYRILDYELIKKTFKFVEKDSEPTLRLQHTSGKKYKILPFTASNNEIESFRGVSGAFSRAITSKKKSNFDKESVFNKVRTIVSMNNTSSTSLLNIIDEVFFDENDELIIAHPQFFNYISSDKNQSDIGNFLASISTNEEIKSKFDNAYNDQPKNVLLKLLHDSLPILEEGYKGKSDYVNSLEHVRRCFNQDLLFLLQNKKIFMQHFQHLLQYYYFYYVTQLILHLDKFFDETPTIFPLFYNFNWENRMQTRRSYTEGWKVVEPKLHRLFAHVNCLEMINSIVDKHKFMGYKQFQDYVLTLDESHKQILNNELINLTKEYKARVKDVPWDGLNERSELYEEPALNSVRGLFYHIDFQFKNSSSRKKKPQEYFKGFYEFSKKTFLKQSGSLGYTLNLKQEYIILLTKVCIGEKEKIALNDLFVELELRGIYLDRDSKRELVELYEKLNLLEKKSDSGDAQYVKYIS